MASAEPTRTRSHRVSSGPKKNSSSRASDPLITVEGIARLRSVIDACNSGLIPWKNILVADIDHSTGDLFRIETVRPDKIFQIAPLGVRVAVKIELGFRFVVKKN